jgi:hypothetical protein
VVIKFAPPHSYFINKKMIDESCLSEQDASATVGQESRSIATEEAEEFLVQSRMRERRL